MGLVSGVRQLCSGHVRCSRKFRLFGYFLEGPGIPYNKKKFAPFVLPPRTRDSDGALTFFVSQLLVVSPWDKSGIMAGM